MSVASALYDEMRAELLQLRQENAALRARVEALEAACKKSAARHMIRGDEVGRAMMQTVLEGEDQI